MSNDPAPASQIPMPKTLFGYDVVDRIGEGAGSSIYVVSHTETGQIYAMKHVRKEKEKDIRFFEQLENEFQVSQKFAHPGLRRSVDLKTNGSLFRKPTEAVLVMEMFDGIPLSAKPNQEVDYLLDIFIQVAKALHAMHMQGYVHCDLKPNNILLDSAGQVKVIDFGQACKMGTVKSRIQGTPDFIAPEQVKCEPVGTETDIYNLGATFYWALCGQPIPTVFTVSKRDKGILSDGSIPTPMSLNPNVPEALSQLVMECVKLNAGERPDDLKELAHRLELVQHSMRRHAARAGAAATRAAERKLAFE